MEPNFFKMFILQQREGISSFDDLYQSEANPNTAEYIAGQLNISVSQGIVSGIQMIR